MRWGWGVPWSYTGPVSLVEQRRFRATHDNLQRIDVWAEIDGGASAEIFARLTPEGSDRPVRESRADVRGARFSNATVTFEFAPIPNSGGTLYTLAIGVLSGPTPYVFLGLTGDDVIPEGAAVVSGAPTPYADDVPMRTTWSGRFIERLLEGLLQQDHQKLKLFGAVTRDDPPPVGDSGRRRLGWAVGTPAAILAPLRLALGPHQRPHHGRHPRHHPGVRRAAVVHAARLTAAALNATPPR